jgi:hypothetical protein
MVARFGVVLSVVAVLVACDTDEASEVTATSAKLNLMVHAGDSCDGGCAFFWEYTTDKSQFDQAGVYP